MSKELITISGLNDVSITSTEDARAAKGALLVAASRVVSVNDANDAGLVANVLKDIKAFTRSVESTRKVVKDPVLAQGKRIDALANELTAQLESEATRISAVLGVWTNEQNRIAEEARRKAYEEEQRIRREAEAREAEAREKAWREQQELERKQSVARNATNAAKYAAEAEARALKAKQEQEARDLATEQAIVQTRVNAAAVAAPKPAGVATRNEIRFEVENVTALYEAAPYLVSLTPNTAAIKNALKGLANGQHLPGVRHWVESVAIVR